MRQIRDTAFGRKHKIRQVHRPVHLRFLKFCAPATHELGLPRCEALPPFMVSKANYAAVKNYPQPSLEARGDSMRQQESLKASPVKAVPSKSGMTYIWTENRQWHTVLAVDSVSSQSIASVKEDGDVTEALLCVTRTRRSTYWQMILDLFKGLDQIIGCSLEDLKRSLEYGSDMLILENCIDNLGNPQNLRAIEAYSGGARLDAKLQSNIQSQYGWTKFLYHIESSHDDRSTVEGEESAVKEEDKLAFSQLWTRWNFPMLTPLGEENEPRMIPYKNEMEKWSEIQYCCSICELLETKEWNFIKEQWYYCMTLCHR